MRRFFLFLTPAASALALACSDNAGVTNPDAGVVPSFGAAVDRFQAPWPEVYVDPQSGLTLVVGATFDPQQLFDIICVGQAFTEVADWLAVTHPASGGGTVTHINIKDKDPSVIVWGTASEDICDELVIPEVPPLAVGTARLTFTDNDFAGTSGHTDSFGERIEGTVANSATGQRYHLTAAFRVLGQPDGPPKVLQAPFVQLTPMGR